MYVILGHTWKRETFVIGHTTDELQASGYVLTFPAEGTDEYRWVEAQSSQVIA